MDAYMIGRGSRRRHQDRQEHEIFPLHDDDAYFGPELNYDNSFDHLESEDYSGDDDSQLRTEIVDYTNLEAPKEHRLQGRVSSQRSTRIPAPAAGCGGSAGFDPPQTLSSSLPRQQPVQRSAREQKNCTTVHNPSASAQHGLRGRMPRESSNSNINPNPPPLNAS